MRSRTLVNACGPFADAYNAQCGIATRFRHVLSKGVHLIVRRLSERSRIMAFFATDGRLFFAIPMGHRSCIGTTDSRAEELPAQTTDEDRAFFPELIGKDWLEAVHHGMANFKDESFILQFLSPKVIRDLKLFSIVDDDKEKEIQVTAIHDDQGYRRIREELADQYNLSKYEPNIQVYEVDLRGNRSITLRHIQQDRIPLQKDDATAVMKHLHALWRFDVQLESIQDGRVTTTYLCDDESVRRIANEAVA